MTGNNHKEFNHKLIKSILTIILYFTWPLLKDLSLKVFSIKLPTAIIVHNIIFSIMLMLILIILYWSDLARFAKDFKNNYRKYLLTIIKYFVFTIVAVFITYLVKIYVFNIQGVADNDLVLYTYFKPLPLLMFFMTVIYYPIVEEIVFNHTVKELIKKKWIYILVSALFFWYFNIAYIDISYVGIVSSFYYFVLAIFRAYAYYKTDNLLVPIGIKMLYNTFVSIISL